MRTINTGCDMNACILIPVRECKCQFHFLRFTLSDSTPYLASFEKNIFWVRLIIVS